MLKTALPRRLGLLGVSLAALSLSPAVHAEDAITHITTTTPIKHVIIIVGENRSFDHLFATYVPTRNETGSPISCPRGSSTRTARPDRTSRRRTSIRSCRPRMAGNSSAAPTGRKPLYATLPAPDVGGVGAVSPYAAILTIPGGDPGLPPQDQFLFGTGGTGLSFTLGPDTRITNVNALAARTVPADRPDDAIRCLHGRHDPPVLPDGPAGGLRDRREHVSRDNPTGCLHDLQSAVTTTYSTARHGNAARHRPDDGVLQHAAGRRAVLQDARRPLHDERQLPPAGVRRHGSRQPAARLRRSGVLQRRQRQSGDAARGQHLRPGSAARNAEPLHAPCAVVQLLGRDAARHRGDRELSEGAALPRADQLRPGQVFQGGQRQSRIHAQGPGAVGARRAADDAAEHRRRV